MLTTADSALIMLLRSLRAQREVSQEDVARTAGITVAAYARIERGVSNPSWHTVRAILKAHSLTFTDVAIDLDAPITVDDNHQPTGGTNDSQ